MLVAAGLGGSTEAFRQVGVSRFDGGRKIELGTLEREATRAVIRDRLVNDGGVDMDTTEWEEKIAQQTYGWPQHIMAYVWPAIRYLKENDGPMSAKGLDIVLRKRRGDLVSIPHTIVSQTEFPAKMTAHASG